MDKAAHCTVLYRYLVQAKSRVDDILQATGIKSKSTMGPFHPAADNRNQYQPQLSILLE